MKLTFNPGQAQLLSLEKGSCWLADAQVAREPGEITIGLATSAGRERQHLTWYSRWPARHMARSFILPMRTE
jgi:hypothetical protein